MLPIAPAAGVVIMRSACRSVRLINLLLHQVHPLPKSLSALHELVVVEVGRGRKEARFEAASKPLAQACQDYCNLGCACRV